MQSELNALHYAVPLSGVFDEGTANAVIAYRKMTGLERTGYAGRGVFERLARGAGGFMSATGATAATWRAPDQTGARRDRPGR